MPKQKLVFTPPVLDLVLYAGDGNDFRLVVTDPTGAPIPLTGMMKAQVRATREAVDPPDATFEVDIVTEGENGIANLKLPGDQTDKLVTDTDTYSGVWDLEWTATGEEPLTICQGKVECLRDVTH